MSLRAILVGAVNSTAVALEEIAGAEGWSMPMVVTLPDELQTRHSDFCDLAPLAERAGARLLRARNSNDPQAIAEIRAMEPDYVFVIGWSQICRPEFLNICPGKAIGYHPAPLPRLRGRAAIPWTILLAEPITAGSLFWLADGADTGDLLAQEFFHVASDETAQELYDKHLRALRRMLRSVLADIAGGIENRTAQDNRYATVAARRTPEDGRIDWRLSAEDISRLVRAVGRPYPGAFTELHGGRLVVWSAAPLSADGTIHAAPGQIVKIEGDTLTVQTGHGLLEIHEWEREETKPIRLHQFFGRTGN